MNLRTMSVPEYVANEFNHPLCHPSPRPDAVEKSIERVYKLIYESLKGIEWPDWEVDNRRYHSSNCNEPYGFERVDDKFYIYAEERGRRSAVAIFKNDHLAADYFVWLVSDGKAKIDWSLFLDMEP